ncbi:FAD-dependent oxidoreductase [Nocardia alni]|uniref:FAD-dependent oxidoreductase n=1 Tax=Nocardia alni TaxID=2815723 RepID=UPI001C24A903|nr:FAD-dependent oxidoreductase [Nocardia alni]
MYKRSYGSSKAIRPETFRETALRTGRAVVVGHGIVGHQVVYELFSAGRRASRPIEILWVADRHDRRIASFGASGCHMPFLNRDPRAAEWARRSFQRWDMLYELGFGDLLGHAETVFLTREDRVELPPGHPGTARMAAPADFSPFYHRAAVLDSGSVVSACALMPRLFRAVSDLPGVTALPRHLSDIGDLLTMTVEFGAELACVAAGDRAQFLLGERRIEGDFGALLLIDLHKVPEPFDRMVLMDQDREHELTYSVPHRACGHVCLGGVSGRLVTEPEEYEELARGLDDPARVPRYVVDAIHEIRDRVLERLPVFGPALAAGDYLSWYGLRPAAERAIAEWVPWSRTGNLGVLHLGGLGGSGFTLTPAFVTDGMNIRRPTQGIETHFESHLGRPTPAHSS